jgi:hypothetical protein
MPDEFVLRAPDPYSDDILDHCPPGGARKEIVREVVTSTPRKPKRENAIDPARLLRAPTLVSKRVGPGQYKVASSSRAGVFYWIDVNSDQPCECEDNQFGGGRMCKHFLHCLLREGSESLLMALGQILLRNEKLLAEHLGGMEEE